MKNASHFSHSHFYPFTLFLGLLYIYRVKHLIILLLLISSVNLSAQYTAIPDPNFEQALIWEGHDNVIDGKVFTVNINTVTSLNVTFSSISDLTGIEGFTALTHLYCGGNQLSSLDLSQNTALTELICSTNSLTSLDFSQNTALTYLSCGTNPLTSLNVSQNTGLTHLFCPTTSLTSLDVSQNIALTRLNCSGNQITSLDVSQNTSLTQLYCHNNQLTSLDVTQNTALNVLGCSNQLTSLNVSQNTALTFLDCDNNLLTSLDVSQNIALTKLICYNNQLTRLNVSQNIALTNLTCYNNQLTRLNVSENTALTFLWCYNNRLTCLNVKNGNNINFQPGSFNTTNSPNLTCIEVDDVAYSTTWWNNIDPQTSFSTSCPDPCRVGKDELTSSSINIHPNPTSGAISISLNESKSGSLRVLNPLGQVVFEEGFKTTAALNISLDGPSGLYFIQLEINGNIITEKMVKE